MTIGESKCLDIPSIAASAALGLHGKTAFSATGRKDDDAAAGSAATTRVVKRPVIGRGSVGGDGCRSRQTAGTNTSAPSTTA